MKTRKLLSSQWILAGALAIGLVGYAPIFVRPALAENFDRTVTIDDVPREVRHVIDAEARGHTIASIQKVRRGDHEFVRVVIVQEHGAEDKILRIGMDGRIFSKEEVTDDWVPPRHYLREEEIRVNVEHPERVEWERIPPHVRAVLGEEAEGEHIDVVVAYRDHDRVIFQTNVRDADNPHKTRVIEVTYDGHLYGEANVGPDHPSIQEVRFDEIPRAVRDTIIHESEGHKFETITARERRGHTFYVVDFPTHRGQRWLTIDRDGHIISDVIDG